MLTMVSVSWEIISCFWLLSKTPLMTLTCTSGMMSSFAPGLGAGISIRGADATGLRGSCHTLASVLQARLQ
jgi:hypothetical protein